MRAAPGWGARTALLAAASALLLAGCEGLPWAKKEGAPAAAAGAAAPSDDLRPGDEVKTVRLITAQTPAVKAWRKVAAQHIYKAYPKRIYKGKIPPLVYAVVVVETDLDANGKVVNVSFSRTPSHAPEVPPKIAELIRASSPFPSPGKLGAHTYVDTWLWDKSGNFQIDTLTLGQRSR